MYCSACGTQIPDGQTACPNCTQANPAPVQASVPVTVKKHREPTKAAKGYAAIFTALMVFPAMICTVINLIRDDETFWAGYVLGALACIWVCCVLPILKITPPVATAIICFATLSCYILYIAKQTGHFEWFYSYVMPMCLLVCLFAAMDAALIGTRVKGLRIGSLLMGQSAIFFIVWEILRDNAKRGVIDLRWSLILACGFASVIAVLEAFNYVYKLNKK